MTLDWAKRAGKWAFLCASLMMPISVAADQITVFAAASLRPVLSDISQAFKAKSGHDVVVSLAGSSALARQIQLGAPADVFISANIAWMDVLEDADLLLAESRFNLTRNQLVIIAPISGSAPIDLEKPGALRDRLQEKPLAMALVDAVPAGIYGKAALRTLGHWSDVSKTVAQTDNVRAALGLVSVGEAPLGVVYATDALADPNVSVVAEIPTSAHDPIVYPAAAIMGGNSETSLEFLHFLQTYPVRKILDQQGFLPVGG